MIKTFRGLLADGGQDTIRLSTNNGLIGYKINKLELMPNEPGDADQESVVQIFKYKQTTIDGKIDFGDPTCIAAGHVSNSTTTYQYPPADVVIVDTAVFNQDIFITHEESKGSSAVNWYLELEQVKLDLNEATVATLKDMRGSN